MSLNVLFMLKEWPKISSQRRGSLVSHSKRLVVVLVWQTWHRQLLGLGGDYFFK